MNLNIFYNLPILYARPIPKISPQKFVWLIEVGKIDWLIVVVISISIQFLTALPVLSVTTEFWEFFLWLFNWFQLIYGFLCVFYVSNLREKLFLCYQVLFYSNFLRRDYLDRSTIASSKSKLITMIQKMGKIWYV